MTTRTVISKSAKRKLWTTPTGPQMVFTEMVVYRTNINGKTISTTRHEKRK